MELRTKDQRVIRLNQEQDFRVKNIAVSILMLNLIAGISLIKWFVFSDGLLNMQLVYFLGFYMAYHNLGTLLTHEVDKIIDNMK